MTIFDLFKAEGLVKDDDTEQQKQGNKRDDELYDKCEEEEDTDLKIDKVHVKVEDAVGKVQKVKEGKLNQEDVCYETSKQEVDEACLL